MLSSARAKTAPMRGSVKKSAILYTVSHLCISAIPFAQPGERSPFAQPGEQTIAYDAQTGVGRDVLLLLELTEVLVDAQTGDGFDDAHDSAELGGGGRGLRLAARVTCDQERGAVLAAVAETDDAGGPAALSVNRAQVTVAYKYGRTYLPFVP